MQPLLSTRDLEVAVESKVILQGLTLTVNAGEIHVIMGPNGSGKSTFAKTLMGHPSCDVQAGSMTLDGNDLANLSPDKRAKAGLFLAFQYPHEVEGVRLVDFLRQSYNVRYAGTNKQIGPRSFKKLLDEKIALLGMKLDVAERFLNVGFSGGEKKQAEMLQLATLQPRCAVLDEIDSGLDIDALKTVCGAITEIFSSNSSMGLVIITHYTRILKYITPHAVHVMRDGRIVRSGGPQLASELEERGYEGG